VPGLGYARAAEARAGGGRVAVGSDVRRAGVGEGCKVSVPSEALERRGRATLTALTALAVAALLSWPARADAWDRVQQLIRGTADTLEKGQLTVGIFAPVTYGLTDNLTVASHPVLDLLLLPNIDARLRIYSGEQTVVAVFGAYEQGFLPAADSRVAGTAHVGALATRYLADRVALTGGLSWAPRLDRVAPGQAAKPLTALDHGVAAALTAQWLIDEANLLMLTAYKRFSFGDRAATTDTPSATLAYVRDWGDFQVAIGPMFGNFAFIPNLPADYLSGGTDLPVFLYVDVWWEF
jgi:hypothetical protein